MKFNLNRFLTLIEGQDLLYEYVRSTTIAPLQVKLLAALDASADYQYDSPEEKLNELFQFFETKLDPTPNKQYVPWLAREYARNGFDGVTPDRIRQILTIHNDNKKSSKFPQHLKDLMRLSLAQTIAELEHYQPPVKQQTRPGKDEYTEIFNDAHVRALVVHTQKAAMHYGQNTKWCTAGKEDNKFAKYNAAGELVIMMPKSPRYSGEKYQLHGPTSASLELRDDANDVKDMYPILVGMFDGLRSGLIDVLEKHVPALETAVSFEHTDILNIAVMTLTAWINSEVSRLENPRAMAIAMHMRELLPRNGKQLISYPEIDRNAKLNYEVIGNVVADRVESQLLAHFTAPQFEEALDEVITAVYSGVAKYIKSSNM